MEFDPRWCVGWLSVASGSGGSGLFLSVLFTSFSDVDDSDFVELEHSEFRLISSILPRNRLADQAGVFDSVPATDKSFIELQFRSGNRWWPIAMDVVSSAIKDRLLLRRGMGSKNGRSSSGLNLTWSPTKEGNENAGLILVWYRLAKHKNGVFVVSGAWNDLGRVRFNLAGSWVRLNTTPSRLEFIISSELRRLPEPPRLMWCGERPRLAKHSVETAFRLSCEPSFPEATRLLYSFSMCFCLGGGGTGLEGGMAKVRSVPWSLWFDSRGGGVKGAGDWSLGATSSVLMIKETARSLGEPVN